MKRRSREVIVTPELLSESMKARNRDSLGAFAVVHFPNQQVQALLQFMTPRSNPPIKIADASTCHRFVSQFKQFERDQSLCALDNQPRQQSPKDFRCINSAGGPEKYLFMRRVIWRCVRIDYASPKGVPEESQGITAGVVHGHFCEIRRSAVVGVDRDRSLAVQKSCAIGQSARTYRLRTLEPKWADIHVPWNHGLILSQSIGGAE